MGCITQKDCNLIQAAGRSLGLNPNGGDLQNLQDPISYPISYVLQLKANKLDPIQYQCLQLKTNYIIFKDLLLGKNIVYSSTNKRIHHHMFKWRPLILLLTGLDIKRAETNKIQLRIKTKLGIALYQNQPS